MWSRLLALALLLLPAAALAGVKEDVAALAPSGLVLVMDAAGNELVAQNTDKPFVPASVTKIVTAWLAMEVLGGDYRFETRFYLDDKRKKFQHCQRRAQQQQGALRRDADPDHPARDHPVPAAGPERKGPHQPEPGPNGEPAICRRADRRVHRAGRRQREGEDLDRNRAQGTGAGLRSPPVAYAFGDPRPAAPRLEQLHRQPGLPGDRRAPPRRASQPREVAPGRERNARRAW